MAKTEHYYEQFLPDCFYHVYNRAVDKKPLFRNDGNYFFFLRRYDKYLSPLVETYSYALCGNHFHFCIKIKPEAELNQFLENKNWQDRFPKFHDVISHQFQSFFLSYAKAFNVQHGRIGALFQSPFKRCPVETENYLVRLILYHHANPQRHRISKDFRTYPWTSYPSLISNKEGFLQRENVLALFGGTQKFIEMHNDINFVEEDLTNL